jgi:peptide/nickel transport system substrate-binding protein
VRKTKWLTGLTAFALVGGLLVGCNSNKESNPSPSASGSAPASSPTATSSAPAAGTPVDGGTLTVSTFGDISTVNPVYVTDTGSGDIQNLLYANIYDLDRNGKLVIEPWSLAAELPKVSEDGKSYTVKLKSTPKWNDGQPVTVDDIIYTFDLIRNPEAGAPGISLFDKIDKMNKIDEQTVEITLKQVYAPFQYSLYTAILPAHILKDVPAKKVRDEAYGKDPAKTVSNGPWKWSEWKPSQYISVEADPNYWGEKKPHIAKIIYNTRTKTRKFKL